MNAALDVTVRIVRPDDAVVLSRLETDNREYMLSGGPLRSEEYISVEGQQDLIAQQLEGHRAGACVPFVIEADGEQVGRITLVGILRGALQSGSVGYWVAEPMAGRGIASRALGLVIEHAFTDLGLHRIQAETTLTNHASAHILTKAGFEQFGLARDYLRIGGRWLDHRMFQLLNEEWTEST
jgi:[ribosomal protein S5]-alanine N-acetyltransferase